MAPLLKIGLTDLPKSGGHVPPGPPLATGLLLLRCEKLKELKTLLTIPTKGQLISECLFEKIVWTKIPTKNLIDSAQQRLLPQG